VLEIFTSSSLLGQGAGIESTSIVLVTTKRERKRETSLIYLWYVSGSCK
jgi:hypothetical protein